MFYRDVDVLQHMGLAGGLIDCLPKISPVGVPLSQLVIPVWLSPSDVGPEHKQAPKSQSIHFGPGSKANIICYDCQYAICCLATENPLPLPPR